MGDEEFKKAVWAEFESKIDAKNNAFKDEVKTVVGSLVNREIERIETKIDSNQKVNETNMANFEKKLDNGLANMESNLLKAIADKQAIPAPAPPPGSRPGSAGDGGASAPTFSVRDAQSRFEPRPGGTPASPPPPWVDDVTTPHFNRAPDATKLFCNIHDRVQVARNHFREKLLVLILESGLKEEDYSLIGDPLDSRFEIQFAGDNRIASVRAKQFHTSLQLGRGKWKTQEVEDSLGTNHKFYINPDKNPAQMRREVLAKRLKDIVSPLCINKDFFVKKSSGSLYCDRQVVVSVILTGEESARLQWCHPKRIQLKLEQEAIEEAFGQYVLTGGQSS